MTNNGVYWLGIEQNSIVDEWDTDVMVGDQRAMEAIILIEGNYYSVLHAPDQNGNTVTIDGHMEATPLDTEIVKRLLSVEDDTTDDTTLVDYHAEVESDILSTDDDDVVWGFV